MSEDTGKDNFQEDLISKDKGKGKGKGGDSNPMREGNVRSIYIAGSSEVIVCEGTRGSGGEGSGVSTSGAVPLEVILNLMNMMLMSK